MKLPLPPKRLLVKLMVNCCASGIHEVTCTAKSDWYLPGNILSANSFNICVIFAAWFWLTQNRMDLPISPEIGSRKACSKNVLQNILFVFSENSFFSKSLCEKVVDVSSPSSSVI